MFYLVFLYRNAPRVYRGYVGDISGTSMGGTRDNYLANNLPS